MANKKRFHPTPEDRQFSNMSNSEVLLSMAEAGRMVATEIADANRAHVTVKFEACGLTHDQIVQAITERDFNVVNMVSAIVTTASIRKSRICRNDAMRDSDRQPYVE